MLIICDFCELHALVEGNKPPESTPLPDGWIDLTVDTADRLTFHSELCLTRFVRSLNTYRRDGTAEMVGSVNYYLDRETEPVPA